MSIPPASVWLCAVQTKALWLSQLVTARSAANWNWGGGGTGPSPSQLESGADINVSELVCRCAGRRRFVLVIWQGNPAGHGG
eukprot:7388168-Prymnesium_polylepis.1